MDSHKDTHGPANQPSEEHGYLQRLVDELFCDDPQGTVTKMDALMRVEMDDPGEDLREVVDFLPGGGSYTRQRLCDQMNSIVTAHGWACAYGTVE